jgi:hypothetical protein
MKGWVPHMASFAYVTDLNGERVAANLDLVTKVTEPASACPGATIHFDVHGQEGRLYVMESLPDVVILAFQARYGVDPPEI